MNERPMRVSQTSIATVEALTVTVAGTPTQVIGPQQVTQRERANVHITNLDGSQTFSGVTQFGPTASGPWTDSSRRDLEALAPGATAWLNEEVSGARFWRLLGQMSGAGGDVRVWGFLGRWQT